MKISFLAEGIAAFQHNENVVSLFAPGWHAGTSIVKTTGTTKTLLYDNGGHVVHNRDSETVAKKIELRTS